MKLYRSNSDYRVALSMAVVVSVLLTVISVSYFTQTGSLVVLLLFVPGIAVLYFALFALPREILLEADRVILKALLRTASIELEDIKGVKEVYSSSALNRVDGDMEKVDIIYFLRLTGKPWRVVFFGNHILEYKELAARLGEWAGS